MNVITQQNKSTNMMKNPFTPIEQSRYPSMNTSDQYPRYQPVNLNANLPEAFNIWPPTPKVVGNNKQPPVHEPSFTYSLPEDYSTNAPAWDPSVLGLPDSQSLAPHNIGIAQQFDSPIDGTYTEQLNSWDNGRELLAGNGWNKARNDYSSVLDGSHMGSSYGSSEDSSVLDHNRYSYPSQAGFDSDSLSLMTAGSRRISDASTSLSSQEPQMHNSDQQFDDYSHSYDSGSLTTDYTHRSSMASLSHGAPLSPVMSPRQTGRVQVRAGSRSRTSPSPRPTLRTAPYSMDGNRNKRWSTGSYYSTANKNTNYFNSQLDNLLPMSRNVHSHHTSPTCSSAHPHPHPHPHSHMNNQMLLSHSHGFPRHGNGMVSSSFMDTHDGSSFMAPMLRGILASNVESHHSHYADLTDPPDLYASLHEEQIPPPPEDMNPEDPDAKPHEQDLRFEGDLYTPRWVRNHGNRREGWCGICKPGRWLVLKNSAFWYDKSFTHGISAATGQQFVEPKEVRRMDGNPDVWEGLCHSCNEWVALVSNKKKGTTWFRHAYKCHTHPKIKDAPKRRRESSQGKAAAAAKMKTDIPASINMGMTTSMNSIKSEYR